MLKYRILTGLVLIPLFIFLIFYLSPPAFCGLTALLVIVGASEWSGFLGIKTGLLSWLYPMIVGLALLAAFLLPIPIVLYAAGLFWLIAAVLVIIYPRAKKYWGSSYIIRGVMGIMVLVPCWLAINDIRNANSGIITLLYIFILIWTADSVAYFVGRQWGKHKLIPEVSPGKSIQGLVGAMVSTFLVAIMAVYILTIPSDRQQGFLVLSLVTVLFSILGDLFESMLKRNVHLKDSGRLLPGHGGILDRIDSLTAAAPIFALGAMWLQ